MASHIRPVDYFYVTVEDQPGQAYEVLNLMARQGLNLLAFTGVPVGVDRTQLALFPENSHKFTDTAKKVGLNLDGPHRALLVQGDDEMGALAGIHEKLFQAKVNVYASMGVTDGKGSYGYLIYVRPDEYEHACRALGV